MKAEIGQIWVLTNTSKTRKDILNTGIILHPGAEIKVQLIENLLQDRYFYGTITFVNEKVKLMYDFEAYYYYRNALEDYELAFVQTSNLAPGARLYLDLNNGWERDHLHTAYQPSKNLFSTENTKQHKNVIKTILALGAK